MNGLLIWVARMAAPSGLATVSEPVLDYARLLARVREVANDVRASSTWREQIDSLAVSVYEHAGVARFVDQHTIETATGLRLRAEKFQPYWHQRVPANDGGIALGQIMAARRQPKKKGESCVWQFQEKSNTSLATTR